MNRLEQSNRFLRQYITVKTAAPWVAARVEKRAKECLYDLDGMAGSWRTDYPYTTYCSPQRINGALVDLSTSEAVRKHIG